MGYVYRYTDLEDNIIKYVGIVWSNRPLLQRIKEHQYNDSWCINKKWKIEYIKEDINTRTDAEYFEAHYISLYQTDKYFNTSKAGWGVSSFLPNREDDWVIYKEESRQHIFEISLKHNKFFNIKMIPVNIKECKDKKIKSHDYHCRCGSNELYKTENDKSLYCKDCDSWVKHCDNGDRKLYTPEYNGEYVVKDGKIATYEYYSFTSAKNKNIWHAIKKEELANTLMSSYDDTLFVYALSDNDIEKQKLYILKHANMRQLNKIREFENQLKELKEKYGEFIDNFGNFLN